MSTVSSMSRPAIRPSRRDRWNAVHRDCFAPRLLRFARNDSEEMSLRGASATKQSRRMTRQRPAGETQMADSQKWQPLGRDTLAARVAQDIPEGWSVNLGIGIPTLVGNYVPPEREVVF